MRQTQASKDEKDAQLKVWWWFE